MIKFTLIQTNSKGLRNYHYQTNRTIIIFFHIIKYYNLQEYLAHSLIKKIHRKDLMIIVIIQLLMIIKIFRIISKDQHLLMVFLYFYLTNHLLKNLIISAINNGFINYYKIIKLYFILDLNAQGAKNLG